MVFTLCASTSAASTDHGFYYSKASWYGPGLYGNHTSNGTVLTPSTWGVAHKGMKFGTKVRICYKHRCAVAPVIDRGPFVHGRTFDLTRAVAVYLRFSGVQTVRWQFA
jgi:Lipoproteins